MGIHSTLVSTGQRIFIHPLARLLQRGSIELQRAVALMIFVITIGLALQILVFWIRPAVVAVCIMYVEGTCLEVVTLHFKIGLALRAVVRKYVKVTCLVAWCGDLHLQDRACALSTDPHTEYLGGDRPHQARASGMDAGANGLFDSGPQGVCHVPGHGLGGVMD